MRKTLGVLLITLFLAPSVSWALPLVCTTKKEGISVDRTGKLYTLDGADTFSIKKTSKGIEAKRIGSNYVLPCKVKKYQNKGKPVYICTKLEWDSKTSVTFLETLVADMTKRNFNYTYWSSSNYFQRYYGDCEKF